MRTFVLVLLAAFAGSAAALPIDLDAPGAMDRLRTDNPRHYQNVVAIVERARAHPVPEVATWINAVFDHSEAEAVVRWYVSNPPKARLSFTLERQEYTMVLVDESRFARLIPAR